MSLINDAIKRANQVSQRSPGPSEGIRLRPVETPRGPNILPLIVLPLLLAIILGVGGWFLWKGLPWAKKTAAALPTNAVPAVAATNRPTPPTPAPTTAATPPVTVTKPPTNPAPAVTEPVKPVAAARTSKPETNVSGPVVAIAPPPLIANKPNPPVSTPGTGATPLGPPPVFPDLKLQGIFYRRSNPTALVNGESVGVGDQIKGVRVVAIERSSITVELSGHRKIIAFQ